MRPRFNRRLLAVVAAYALALQGLLAPLSSVHADNVDCQAMPLQGGDAATPAQPPHSDGRGCDLCAVMCGGAPAVLPAAGVLDHIQWTLDGDIVIATIGTAPIRVEKGIGLARAPPALN